jgi:GTPase SAR1 family protein
MQVNYKNVMSEYKLGPNGGILTACNLFATRFDQVMALCEKPRPEPLEVIVVDTAGQIEIFTWSASGNIITELFASSFPTVVLYVIDTPRCLNPQTFMSNMMQACSILYKTRLPMILVRSRSSGYFLLLELAIANARCFGARQSAGSCWSCSCTTCTAPPQSLDGMICLTKVQ